MNEEAEKGLAVRNAIKPYKSAIRNTGCLLILGSCFSAIAGQWLLSFGLLVVLVVAGIGLGMWVSRLGPADDSQRSSFRVALGLAGIGQKSLPSGCVAGMLPWQWFIGAFVGAGPYIRAARRGASGREWLRNRMNSADAFERWRAVATLGNLKDAESIPLFVARLEDPHPAVREAAAKVLGEMGLTDFLTPALADDAEDLVWLHATAAACRKGLPVEVPSWRLARLENLARDNPDCLNDADEALGSLPVASVRNLVLMLVKRPGPKSLGVLTAIGRQRTPEARELLLEVLRLDDPVAVRSALLGLVQLRDPSTLAAVEPFAAHVDPDIQRVARFVVSILKGEARDSAGNM